MVLAVGKKRTLNKSVLLINCYHLNGVFFISHEKLFHYFYKGEGKVAC